MANTKSVSRRGRKPSAVNMAVNLIGLSAIWCLLVFGTAPLRITIASGAAVLLGAFIYKLFPIDISRDMRPGAFWPTTWQRAVSAVGVLTSWSGACTIVGGLAGLVIAWLSNSDELTDRTAWASLWGLVAGGAVSMVVWTSRRTIADRAILNRSQTGPTGRQASRPRSKRRGPRALG
jgi:uncharacterized membrane protein YuzA (DUF378 family)